MSDNWRPPTWDEVTEKFNRENPAGALGRAMVQRIGQEAAEKARERLREALRDVARPPD